VDPDAEANFLSSNLVDALFLPLLPMSPFHVEVGNAAIEQGLGGCKDITLVIQGITIVANFLVMELGHSEVVLSTGWVVSLRKFEGDYRNLSLSWFREGKQVTLKGDPTQSRSQANRKMMMNALRNDEEGFIVTPVCRIAESEYTQECSTQVQELLQEFEEIFATPSGLPPRRPQDHPIVLKEHSDILNIRPYRYPHYQKAEMERIIEEMLQIGIIGPSTSPFSSLVILVRKKDGGWCFCVDYRAPNKIIIPDKFSIPVIEELLDELVDATIFSKLDLKSGYHQICM